MQSAQHQSHDAISAPVILAGIAGLLILLGGIGSLMMIGWFNSYNAYWPMMRGMMGNWSPYGVPQMMSWWWIGSMSLVSVAIGAIILGSAYMLYRQPNNAKQWGLFILAGSILGLLWLGGFAIGSILGIIGGALAISKGK